MYDMRSCGLDSREFNRIALRADNRCCLRNFPKNDDYGMDGKNIVAVAVVPLRHTVGQKI